MKGYIRHGIVLYYAGTNPMTSSRVSKFTHTRKTGIFPGDKHPILSPQEELSLLSERQWSSCSQLCLGNSNLSIIFNVGKLFYFKKGKTMEPKGQKLH